MEEPKVYWVAEELARRVQYDEDSVIDIAEQYGNVMRLKELEDWINCNTENPKDISRYHFIISNKEQWQQ